MSITEGKSEVKKYISWPKSHAEWNVLFLYAIPTIGILLAALVFFIRFISARL